MNDRLHLPQDPASDRLSPSRPWPGLASFAESDRNFFRGRDRESDELARLVRRERLTVLFGRSGLGKTSLLRAGLFPRLREDLHMPVLIRLAHGASLPLRQQVWRAIEAACTEAVIDATPPLPGATLWEHFHRADAGFWNVRNRAVVPVLVFDQFEELFTHGAADEETRRSAAGFMAELADLVEDRPPEALRHALEADHTLSERVDFRRLGCKVVLSFREDFLAEMEGWRDRMPSLMRNRYRLTPMNGRQALEVVASGGLLAEGEVGERIIGLAWNNQAKAPPPDHYDRMEVDPALLSVICSELNLRRIAQGSERIGADLLAGAEKEILADFYGRSLSNLDPRVREFVEDELITEAGFRDSHALEDALALPGITRQAIDRLVAGRLLSVDDRFGVRRLELSHDVLTRVVKESRDARQAREAEAAAAAREREALAAQQRNRRQAVWIGGAGVLAIGLLVAAGISIREAVLATQRLDIATQESAAARREAEQARVDADAASDRSLRMAERAAEANLRAEEETEKSRRAAELASLQEQRAADATARAARLTRDALATDLIANARTAQSSSSTSPSQPDRALLLGAEASHRHPERLDAQLAQLSRLIANEGLRKLLRIEGGVTASAGAPDGRRAALGTDRGEIFEVDLVDWRVVRRWKAHEEAVHRLAYGGDASRIVSTDESRTMIAWQPDERRELGRVALAGLPRGLQRMVVSPRGNFVAMVGHAGEVDLWPLPGRGEAASVRRVGTQADGSCLFVDEGEATLFYGASGGVRAWKLPDAGEVPLPQSPQSPQSPQKMLARSPDCRFDVELGSRPDGKSVIALRDARTGTVLGALGEGAGDKTQIAFERAGRFVAVRSGDATTVWATGPLREVGRVQHRPGAASALAIDPGGRWLATSLPSGEITVQSVADGALRVKTRLPQGVSEFQFSPSGDAVAGLTRGQERVHPIWQLAAPKVLRLGAAVHQAEEIEFNRTGSVLATVEPGSSTAHFWDPASAKHLRKDADMQRAEFSPDGSRLAIQRSNGDMEVLDMAGDGPAILQLAKPPGISFRRFAISRDNQRLAVTRSDGEIHVHPLRAGGGRVTVLHGERGVDVDVVVFSPDGKAIAVGGSDGVVRLHRFDSRAPEAILSDPHLGGVLQMAFSPDGKRLATGGADRMVRLRDVAKGQTVASFGPHDWEVERLVFIEGGDALLSGESKGGRDIWDIRKGRRLARLRATDDSVKSVDISPTGRRVAVLRADNTVLLRSWDHRTMLQDACDMAGRNLECSEWRQFMPDVPYRKTCPALPAPEPMCR